MFSLKPFASLSWLISLILLVTLFSLPVMAQENEGFDEDTPQALLTLEILDVDGNPITDFELFARHSQRATVVARYQGAAYGTLRLHYQYVPDFVFATDTHVIAGTDVELVHEFLILPGYVDAGEHLFHIYAEVDFTQHGPWPNMKVPVEIIHVNVLTPDEEDCSELAPIPVALPEFSGGPVLGNAVKLEYTPSCGAEFHTGEVVDLTFNGLGAPGDANKEGEDGFHSIRFSDLTDGHRYGFEVTAHYPDSQSITSEMVSTIIDVSAPGIVGSPEVIALPGGHVQVTWNLVQDSISGVDYYLLKRKMVIPGGYDEPVTVDVYGDFNNAGDSYTYLDEGDDLIDGAQYNYWVETVDNVRNTSYGALSTTIIPDGVLPLVPSVQLLNDILVGELPFIADPELVILANSDGTGLESTDFVIFEIVRGNPGGFGGDHYLGTINFVSDWIDYQAGGTQYTGSVVPDDGNLVNVNNQSFHVRARAKDAVGNLSPWSYEESGDSVVFARADLFPPSAITNLDGVPDVVEGNYTMNLSWNVPSDNTGSGVQTFLVYDRIVALPRDETNLPAWSPVSEVLELSNMSVVNGYVSHVVPVKFDDMTPSEIEYLVLATDFVGHETEANNDVRRFAFVDRYSPALSLLCDDGCGENCDNILPVLGHEAHVSWAGYFAPGVENMKFILTPAEGASIESIVFVNGQTDFTLPLDFEGDYSLTAQPQFTDQLWGRLASLPLVFTRDLTPPEPVNSLVVDGTGTSFDLAWDAVADANTVSGYIASYKSAGSVDFIDFPGVVDSLALVLPFADEFITYDSYDLSARAFDCVANEQLVGNDIITEVCLRAPIITGHELLNNNETVEISWSRPMPNASGDWRTIITIQPPGDGEPFVKTVHHTTSYHFSPIDENLPREGYYTVTVREMAADAGLQDAQGNYYETMDSAVENILLAGNSPGAITDLEYFFLPPVEVTDGDGHAITMRWNFDAREQDVTARITHGGGNGHAPVVQEVALLSGSNTYILDLDNLKYSDGSSTYNVANAGLYPVEFVVLDLLDIEGPAYSASVDISAAHAITPRVGGYEDGYYSENTLEMFMEHVGYILPANSEYIQYEVQAARTADFEDTLYAVTDWFTNATGETFTPCQDECPDIFLRARARFSWDTSDYSNALVTPWSDEYSALGSKWLKLDVTSPYAVTTLQVTGSSTTAGPQSALVDVHFSWESVDDRYNSSGEGIGIGEYRVYRRAVADTFNFAVPLTVIADSLSSGGMLTFSDLNRPIDGSGPLDAHTDVYMVRPVDLLGNERTRDNIEIQASAIPSAPDQLVATDGDNIGWCWAPLEGGLQVVEYVVERTIFYENLGSDYIFEDVAGEDEDFRLFVAGEGADCPTVTFNHNSAFNNPSYPVYFHVKAVVANGWESAWSDTLVYIPSDSDETKSQEFLQGDHTALVNFVLDQNFPNPFNPQTTVRYHVPRASRVSLRIYDVRGQLVNTLVDGTVEPGSHSVQWYGNDQADRAVSTGIYFYKLETPNETLLRRMVLMR